jgi:hypothetical protein
MKGMIAIFLLATVVLTACAMAPVVRNPPTPTKAMQFSTGYAITVPADVPDMMEWEYILVPIYQSKDFSLIAAAAKNPRDLSWEGMILFVIEKGVRSAIVIGAAQIVNGRVMSERYWHDDFYFRTGTPSGYLTATPSMPDLELLVKTKSMPKKEIAFSVSRAEGDIL